MINEDSKRGRSAAEDGARVEDGAQLADFVAAFREAAEVGPPLIALQQALLSGLVRSQHKEAERLALLHGKGDERVTVSSSRAARYATLAHQVSDAGDVGAHLLATLQTDGVFHGYVTDVNGEPQEGHTVRVAVHGMKPVKQAFSGSAETDARGYFRIALHDAASWGRTSGVSMNEWAQRLGRVVMGSDAPPQAEEAGRPETAQGPVSSVAVLDPKGTVVYEDQMPPSFSSSASEFRYYVLEPRSTKSTKYADVNE